MRFSCTKLKEPKYKPIHFHPAWVFTRATTIFIMQKLFFSGALLLCLGLAIQSCKKENIGINNTDKMTAEDLMAHNDLSEQLDIDTDEALDGFMSNEVEERNDCPVVTFQQPKGTWPNTITLDYSDAGCTKNGRTYKGKIVVTQTNPMNITGAVRNLSFENFFIEGVQISGTKTVTQAGLNTAGLPKFNTVTDETLTFPDGSTATHKANRERTQTEGSTTAVRLDDVWTITGSASGVNRQGDAYTVTYTTPLIKRNPCAWISEGVISFQVNNLVRTLDFGDGTCDRDATITLADGTVKNVKIRHHWWK